MAGAPRTPTPHLTALDELRIEPQRFSLFAALRLLEQTFSARPRLAESRKASDDALRLGHAPHLTFAPSDVASCKLTPEGGQLEQYSFGLFGPNGPLPVHLTEHAYERRRHKEDATFVDFLNVFQHRLISLFYRAWANSDPAASFDRPESDRFAMYVGAMMGVAPVSARDRDGVSDYAKLSRAGLFAQQTRSAEGLETILADYFDLPFEVREFVGTWLQIPEDLRCRLGGDKEFATLGQGATLGCSTWQCQYKFEIVLGPLSLDALKNFLPGARGLSELHALVRLYTNEEWGWQLRILLPKQEIPRLSLGKSGQLGWTTWLGIRTTTADDVVIQEQKAAPHVASIQPTAAAA